MGLLDDIFSGRTSDIYGAGLLTPEQRGGIGNRGLLALAAQLGKSAGPSFSPVPDFGAALGMAAGAYGAGTDEAGKDALNAILTGLKGTDLQSQLAIRKQVLGLLPSLLAGDGATAAGAPATSGGTGGGAAAPLGAGGGGGPGSDPRGMIPHITAEATRLGIDPATALQVARSEGLGVFSGDGGKSGGAFQLYTGGGMGNDFQRDTGLDPLDPKNEKATITYALQRAAKEGWGAWNGAKKLGITGFAGIGKPGAVPTAAAPAGGGGLLAVPAPNPLSDAEPMVGIPRPKAPAGAGPAAQAVPWAPGNLAQYARPGDKGGPITVEGVTYPSVSAWNRGMDARARATAQSAEGYPEATGGGTGQGAALEEPPGFAGRQLVAQLLARPPIDDVSQYRQVAGPGAADAAATPRAPLPVMGPTGVELPPMQGPLAAPAPAAAAPAAAAPRGLLAPPAAALPAVPAAPNINARALAAAGVLSQLGGLPDIFKPLENFYYQSPGYKGQVTTAEEAAKSQFVGSNAAATAAAQDSYIRGQAQAKSDLDLRNDLLKQGVVRNADGSLRQATEAELAALTAKDRATPTTEMKDYAGYVKDQQMRNLSALSYFDWSLANKRAGAASTVLNTTEGFEAAQTRARIAIDTKLAETIGDQALTGKRLAPLLDEVIRLANQTPEGMAGPIAVTTARAFSSLGIPVSDRMSNAELLNTITQRLVPIVREPGATSQGELNTYLQASPGLMQSAAGRIKIAEMTKALIARTDEIAKVYRNNLGAPDLHDKLSALDKPLFTDDQRAAMNAVIGGTRTAPAPGAAPGGAPQTRIFNPATDSFGPPQ